MPADLGVRVAPLVDRARELDVTDIVTDIFRGDNVGDVEFTAARTWQGT